MNKNDITYRRNDHSFLELKRLAKKGCESKMNYSLAVLGDFSTQHLCTALKGCAVKHGISLKLWEADYNQIDAQLNDPNSELHSFKANAVLFATCTEMLFERYCALPVEQREHFAQREVERFRQRWDTVAKDIGSTVMQFNYAERDDRIWGDYACINQQSFIFQLRKLNMLLMEEAAKRTDVRMIDVSYCQNRMGYAYFCDEKQYFLSSMPFSLDATVEIAISVADAIKTISGRFVKCIVLDLDGTLWGGIIGDDGLEGIEIGDLGAGKAYSAFQRWLKLLQKRGLILAVCSKNEEAAARMPFEEHPDMVLSLEDFSAFVANWEDKASNISLIQKTLNIGMDSIVFIDDNPFERNAVRTLLPDCIVPELPEDAAMYIPYLNSLNLFETASFSKEDALRAEQYQAEAKREASRQQYASYDEYLESLEMTAVSKAFDPFAYPRIAQLSQRSNQFNMRTIRYTEADIKRIATDTGYETVYFSLSDRMGEYGIISAVIMEKRDKALFIDTWFMSCRVLKRGMEEHIMNKILEIASEGGYEEIIGEYIPTEKNAMVKDLYLQFGFERKTDNLFILPVHEYNTRVTHIKEARDGIL